MFKIDFVALIIAGLFLVVLFYVLGWLDTVMPDWMINEFLRISVHAGADL